MLNELLIIIPLFIFNEIYIYIHIFKINLCNNFFVFFTIKDFKNKKGIKFMRNMQFNLGHNRILDTSNGFFLEMNFLDGLSKYKLTPTFCSYIYMRIILKIFSEKEDATFSLISPHNILVLVRIDVGGGYKYFLYNDDYPAYSFFLKSDLNFLQNEKRFKRYIKNIILNEMHNMYGKNYIYKIQI